MKTLLPTLILLVASLLVRAEAADSPTFVIQPGDISKAAIVLNAPDHATLDLSLTSRKRAELTRFTTENLGQKVSIMIGDTVVAEPVVRDALRGDFISIAITSPEKALEHARSLLKTRP